jgi:hypothetical protein
VAAFLIAIGVSGVQARGQVYSPVSPNVAALAVDVNFAASKASDEARVYIARIQVEVNSVMALAAALDGETGDQARLRAAELLVALEGLRADLIAVSRRVQGDVRVRLEQARGRVMMLEFQLAGRGS